MKPTIATKDAIKMAHSLEKDLHTTKRGLSRAYKTLGQRMAEERTRRGIGLRQLARQLGISPPYLSQMETNARNYTPEWAKKAIQEMNDEPSHLTDD